MFFANHLLPQILEYRDEFSVECEEGYRLVGTKTLSCISDNSFSENLPFCQKINYNAVECPALVIKNAHILGTPLEQHTLSVSALIYTCISVTSGFSR